MARFKANPQAEQEKLPSVEWLIDVVPFFGRLKDQLPEILAKREAVQTSSNEVLQNPLLMQLRFGQHIMNKNTPGDWAFYVLKPAELATLRQRQALDAKQSYDASETADLIADQPVAVVRPHPHQDGLNEYTAKLQDRAAQMLHESDESNDAESFEIDIPVEIERTIRQGLAKLPTVMPGDVVGEVACLYGTLRSATITAIQDCYVIAFDRVVMDFLQSTDEYRQTKQGIYRSTMLMSTLKRSLRGGDDESKRAKADVVLPDLDVKSYEGHCAFSAMPPGQILFHQHQQPDKVYLVQRGLVKVVENTGWFLSVSQFTDTQIGDIAREMASFDTSPEAKPAPNPLKLAAWDKVSTAFKELLTSLAIKRSYTEPEKQSLIDGLNQLLSQTWKPMLFFPGDSKAHDKLLADSAGLMLHGMIDSIPDKVSEWSEECQYDFTIGLLREFCPKSLSPKVIGIRRVITYRGEGQLIGEMGIQLNATRSATCVIYDQPDQRRRGRDKGVYALRRAAFVELVEINGRYFQAIVAANKDVRERIDATIERRRKRQKTDLVDMDRLNHPDFVNHGLAHGQRLMLVDLDKCTRCGDCMRACHETHLDELVESTAFAGVNVSRLFLDGPRVPDQFDLNQPRGRDRFMTPNTCRMCFDPVCLTACPEGDNPGEESAIKRVEGKDGKVWMEITQYCTGCGKCVELCPYGSIHMYENANKKTDFKNPIGKAVVCDMCKDSPLGPACVHYCPHDAAIRINPLVDAFPV